MVPSSPYALLIRNGYSKHLIISPEKPAEIVKYDKKYGWRKGFKHIYEVVPEKFSMILSKGEIITPNGKDAWWDLPGLAVLIGGMWVANLYYWGFNQYIIQRTLAANSIRNEFPGH